jgi:hypothetical protein
MKSQSPFQFDVSKFDVSKYDSILSMGLSRGIGIRTRQVCIEAAICQTLGLPHDDDPQCVSKDVRFFKIKLNDFDWSSPEARAKGLRDLGLAQLGSLGVVSNKEFLAGLKSKFIKVLIPTIIRDLFYDNPKCLAKCLAAATQCESEGFEGALKDIPVVCHLSGIWRMDMPDLMYAIEELLDAVTEWDEDADRYLDDRYLNLIAKLALEVLTELKSPGIALI